MDTKIAKERTHYYAPSINVVMVLTISGAPVDQDIRSAINKAVSRHGILNCKVYQDDIGEIFYSPIQDSNVKIETRKLHNKDDWRIIIAEQERVPFNFESGELIRFFILQHAEKTQLVIIAHHLAGDGISILHLARDIMTSLKNPKEEFEFIPVKLYEESDIPKDAKLNFFLRIMMKSINKQWNKNKKIFTYNEYKEMFCNFWSERKTNILLGEISGIDLQQLYQSCKEHGITINSAIVTAFLTAVENETVVGLAASIRPKGFEGMGNYATGISIRYKMNPAKPFWDNAVLVHKLIYEKLNNSSKKFFLLRFMIGLAPTLIDAAYFNAFAGFHNPIAAKASNMFGYNGNPRGISITNLTKADIPSQYGKYQIDDIVFIPPLVPNTKRIIGVVTLEDTMTVTMQYEDKNSTQMQQIFNTALGLLLKVGK